MPRRIRPHGAVGVRRPKSAATERLDERLRRGHVIDHDVVVDLYWASRLAPDRRLMVWRQLERHPGVLRIRGDDGSECPWGRVLAFEPPHRLLLAWEIGGDVPGTAELCLSELVTNAVIHAGTDSVLTVSLVDGSLTVQVRDRGPGSAADVELVDDEDPMRVFGRGLQLVDALADRWGSEQDADGTTSWFALDVGSAA